MKLRKHGFWGGGAGGALSFFILFSGSDTHHLQSFHVAFCGMSPSEITRNWYITSRWHPLCKHMALFLPCPGHLWDKWVMEDIVLGGPVFHTPKKPFSVDLSFLNWQNCIFTLICDDTSTCSCACTYVSSVLDCVCTLGSSIEHKYDEFDKLHGCSKSLPLWIDWSPIGWNPPSQHREGIAKVR